MPSADNLEKRSRSLRRLVSVNEEKKENALLKTLSERWFGKIYSFASKSYRQRQETMQKMHQIHEALEDDIVETQSGNAKIIDLMHQIIHVGYLTIAGRKALKRRHGKTLKDNASVQKQ